MKFQPVTEQELSAANLLPEGEYDFEIIEAVEKLSKAGNDMVHLKLRVFVGDSTRIVDDYLTPLISFKIRHLADALGMLDQYAKGELKPEDLEGKSGKLKLIIQKSKDPKYSDRNAVKDYVCKSKSEEESDEIPF